MEVKIILDEEEEVLVKYYAELMETSVEDAFKGAIFDRIREIYEAQAKAESRPKCTYADKNIEDETDMFEDEGR